MNLSENFQEMADTMKRPVAIVAMALSALSLSGCATLDRASKFEAGGLPVGRVFTQTATAGTVDARKGLARAASDSIRLTDCSANTAPKEQPRTQGSGLVGALGAAASAISDKLFSVNTVVAVGDRNCTGTTGLVPAPVAPAVGAPRGPGAVQPRPQ